jgi:methionyl-tRNA formyltransferase
VSTHPLPSYAFLGTPAIAARLLQSRIAAGHLPAWVCTRPDKPRGRHGTPSPCEVKALALEHGIPVHHPATWREPSDLAFLHDDAAKVDTILVAAYGKILPDWFLQPQTAPFRVWNMHASLLPHLRGAAPIQRAIQRGDAETGVTIQRVVRELDAGPVFAREVVPIDDRETSDSLIEKLVPAADLAINRLFETLARLKAGEIGRIPLFEQNELPEPITHAAPLRKDEAIIDWEKPAIVLDREVRAFLAWPGSVAQIADPRKPEETMRLTITEANAIDGRGDAGKVIDVPRDAIVVACGERALRITRLKRSGKQESSAKDFLNGCPLTVGMRFAPMPA